MAIEELWSVIPPPDEPTDAGPEERWPEVEQALGIQLPYDYREYALLYGSGSFSSGLCIDTVFNPFAENYVDTVLDFATTLRRRRRLEGRRDVAYGVFPDLPGWLPVARGIEGELLCWVTEGNPDDWPLLLISAPFGKSFHQINLPLTTFLARLHSGSLRTAIDPPGAEDGDPDSYYFRPESSHSLPQEEDQAKPSIGLSGRPQALPAIPASPPRVEWLPRDHLDRPTGVRIFLSPPDVQETARVIKAYPAWWTDELPKPLTQWCRRSLLPWSLGEPEASAPHNLLPVTWHSHYAITHFEAIVSGWVRGERNHLIYTVRPQYEGNKFYPDELVVEYCRQPGSAGAHPFRAGVRTFRNVLRSSS